MSTVFRPADPSATLLNVKAVAEKLGCSTRHVYRLTDSGKMPARIKLGSLVKWPLHEIDQWIANGCPQCRRARR